MGGKGADLFSTQNSFSNTVQSMQAVLEALPLLSVVLLPANQEAAYLVEEVDPDERSTEKELEGALLALWNDPAVKAVLGELRPSLSFADEERADPVVSQRSSLAFRCALTLRSSRQQRN